MRINISYDLYHRASFGEAPGGVTVFRISHARRRSKGPDHSGHHGHQLQDD